MNDYQFTTIVLILIFGFIWTNRQIGLLKNRAIVLETRLTVIETILQMLGVSPKNPKQPFDR